MREAASYLIIKDIKQYDKSKLHWSYKEGIHQWTQSGIFGLLGRRWSVQTRQNKCIDFKLWFMVLRHWVWGPGPRELTPALSVPHPPTDPQQMLPSHACCLHNLCNCSTILPKPGELQVHLFSNDVQWSNKQGHEASLGNHLLGTKHPHKVQICSIRHAGFQ